MIQELLGGSAASPLLGDPKFSFNNNNPPNNNIFQTFTSPPPSEKPHPHPPNPNPPENNTNLRCPRCDSANTKFCYYNNYNLTQPRHFCKTCRRYWTKGGALRNVPIGGGCRKNKATLVTTTSNKSSISAGSSNKFLKTSTVSDDNNINISSLHQGFGQSENSYSTTPNALWASSSSSPQASSSYLLALLRSASQNPNHNPNPNPIVSSSHLVKEENMGGPHMMVNGAVLDHLGLSSSSSLWRNSYTQPNGAVLGDGHMQEVYQRLNRSSSENRDNYNISDRYNSQAVRLLSNITGSSSSSILDSAPVVSTELGYGWNVNNQVFSWSDLPTANGAYPN